MRKWRRPSVFALALTLVGIGAFCALGIWQLGRAEQKRALFAAFANSEQAPIVEFADRDDRDGTYAHVRVSGRYDVGKSYLLDEQIQNGIPGVHAIALFVPENETSVVLVDRGWVAWNHAPGTAPKLPAAADGDVRITGTYATYPGGGLRIGNALAGQTTWPKLTLYLDQAQIAADLGKPVLPRILLLDPQKDDGFVREWKPNVMPPERHLAYAVQWFAFALVAIAIFIGLHWRPQSETNGQ